MEAIVLIFCSGVYSDKIKILHTAAKSTGIYTSSVFDYDLHCRVPFRLPELKATPVRRLLMFPSFLKSSFIVMQLLVTGQPTLSNSAVTRLSWKFEKVKQIQKENKRERSLVYIQQNWNGDGWWGATESTGAAVTMVIACFTWLSNQKRAELLNRPGSSGSHAATAVSHNSQAARGSSVGERVILPWLPGKGGKGESRWVISTGKGLCVGLCSPTQRLVISGESCCCSHSHSAPSLPRNSHWKGCYARGQCTPRSQWLPPPELIPSCGL